MSLSTIELITMLRDRLEEAADCIDCGLEITREAGYTTADAELQIKACRLFVTEANAYLAANAKQTSTEYLHTLQSIHYSVYALESQQKRADKSGADRVVAELATGIGILHAAEADLKYNLKNLGRQA